MVLEASQCSCNGRQIALGASYGFPPPPNALNSTTTRTSNTPPSLPSFISPPTTPLPVSSHQCITLGTQLLEPRAPNLADYLAKKRLYSNHGRILQPACESCHEARKRCDVERPCTRCIKNVIPCIERPPRGKRRKVQQRPPVVFYQKQPSVNPISGGLLSPVSEPQLDARADTPMELDHSSGPVASSVDDTFNPLPCNTPITPIDSSGTGIMGGPSDPSHVTLNISIGGLLGTEPQDLFDVPPPIGNYLEGISLIPSEAPIFGLEGNDPLTERNFRRVLDNDLSMGEGEACGKEKLSQPVGNFELNELVTPMSSAQELDALFGENDLRAGFGQVDDLCSHSMIPNTSVSNPAGNFEWSCDWRIS